MKHHARAENKQRYKKKQTEKMKNSKLFTMTKKLRSQTCSSEENEQLRKSQKLPLLT